MTSMSKTLEQALRDTYRDRWIHCRDEGKSILSQAEAAVSHVADAVIGPAYPKDAAVTKVLVSEVEDRHIRAATAYWYRLGLSPATINKRLNCLSAMGVDVKGCRQRKTVALKWWLRPEEEERATRWLRHQPLTPPNVYTVLADLVCWTTKTGLRIEESLRLTRSDFGDDFKTVTVPGTKTADSQATLPLGDDAYKLAKWVFSGETPAMFPVSYEALEGTWRTLRSVMHWEGNGVTLKALRRSAARYLHVDCGMPLDMVRQYLRHEDIETTIGYLRLTGGYGTEEMRRYLG